MKAIAGGSAEYVARAAVALRAVDEESKMIKIYNGKDLLGTIEADKKTSIKKTTRLFVEKKMLHKEHLKSHAKEGCRLGLGLVELRIVPTVPASKRMDFCIYQENSENHYGRLLQLEYVK